MDGGGGVGSAEGPRVGGSAVEVERAAAEDGGGKLAATVPLLPECSCTVQSGNCTGRTSHEYHPAGIRVEGEGGVAGREASSHRARAARAPSCGLYAADSEQGGYQEGGG